MLDASTKEHRDWYLNRFMYMWSGTQGAYKDSTHYIESQETWQAAQQAAKAGEWRPIESAPRDGRHVLVSAGTDVCKSHWNGECWLESSFEEPRRVLFPTIWHPLPTPPSDK